MASDATALPGAQGQIREEERLRRRRGERGRLASFALHGGLLLASVIAIFPVFWVLITSFKPSNDVYSPKIQVVSNPTLHNYSAVLNSEFPRWFLNSVVVAGCTMALGMFLAATAGYALSRFRFPGHRPLMWNLLVTQMFPMAILIVPLYNLMVRLGLLNSYGGLVLAYCTIAVPFCTYLLKGYFDTIPIEIDEAGRVDGLTPFGTFWRLALPLAKPGLAVTAFYTFLTAWGEVAYASLFMTDEKHYLLAVGLQTYVGQFKAEWGLLSAAAMLVTIPAIGVFYFAQKYLVAGLTAGGTKG